MLVRAEMQQIALAHRRRYGYRRITAELRRQGLLVNHKRVARLMREDNLLAVQPRAFVRPTDASLGSGHSVCLRRVCAAPATPSNNLEYESAAEPVRQCQLRELPENMEAGGDLRQHVSGSRACAHEHGSLHRPVLQPHPAPLGARLSSAGGVRARCRFRASMWRSHHAIFSAHGGCKITRSDRREGDKSVNHRVC